MKHKKTVSDAVRSANRANAKLSTGPRSEKGKLAASHNALRHGILTRKLQFATEGDKKRFKKICQAWENHYRPKGQFERFLVQEVTNISWKLGMTEGVETRELSRREDVQDGVGAIFNGDLKLPVSDFDLPVDRGWDCEQLVVRALADDNKRHSNSLSGQPVLQVPVHNAVQNSQNHHREAGHLEVQAVLASSLDTMTWYRSALKRDFYRATETLRAVQRERKAKKSPHPNGGST